MRTGLPRCVLAPSRLLPIPECANGSDASFQRQEDETLRRLRDDEALSWIEISERGFQGRRTDNSVRAASPLVLPRGCVRATLAFWEGVHSLTGEPTCMATTVSPPVQRPGQEGCRAPFPRPEAQEGCRCRRRRGRACQEEAGTTRRREEGGPGSRVGANRRAQAGW